MKGKWTSIYVIAVYLLCFLLSGVYSGWVLRNMSLSLPVFYLVIAGACMVSFVIHIVFHELGHMVFGMLSGYEFISIRFASLMWVKGADGKIHFKRFSLAGTGGQCLLLPPKDKEHRPYKLYHLGGVIANATVCILIGILLLFDMHPFGRIFCMQLITIGVMMIMTNAVPIREPVMNDGFHAFMLHKYPAARDAVDVQLIVNAYSAAGHHLQDMPEDLFIVPSDEEMKSIPMVSVRAVLTANRLLYAHRFQEAAKLIDHLMKLQLLPTIYFHILMLDRIYIELIGGRDEEVLQHWHDKTIVDFCRSMKNNPSVLRTQYAYEKRYVKSMEKADKLKQRFLNVIKTFPYTAEAEDEKQLITIVDQVESDL